MLRGNRVREAERRAKARAEQDERRRRTGYIGSATEIASAVRLELRQREYAAHLVAFGRQYNFQGQFRLAALTGVVRRTVQRYRARLESEGLIATQLLYPGDMLDDQRAPVNRLQFVRDVSGLIALAGTEPRAPRRSRKPQPLASTAIARPPETPAERMDPDEIRRYVQESILGAPPTRGGRTPAAPERPPVRVPDGCPATIDPREIDQWERDTESLERWREYDRDRDRPPPD
jgi:hypothetical protein